MWLNFLTHFFRDLRRQPLRSFLTLSGVAWGTLSVVALLAFGVGVMKQSMADMHGMGEGIIILWPSRTSLPYRGMKKGRAIRMTPGM